jgi:hypothetical protein
MKKSVGKNIGTQWKTCEKNRIEQEQEWAFFLLFETFSSSLRTNFVADDLK